VPEEAARSMRSSLAFEGRTWPPNAAPSGEDRGIRLPACGALKACAATSSPSCRRPW
jgi:hypothetical protein